MINKNVRRRELLSLLTRGGLLSVTRSPLALFVSAIAPSLLVREAFGASNSIRKWVDVRAFGAPPRWVFDLFLNPLNQQNYISNPHVGTRYVESGGRYTDVEYATFSHSGIQVPWMWQFPLPKSGGGTRPMTDLLAYMLQIRGIHTESPAHAASEHKHFLVSGAVQSAPALTADSSDAPFPAIIYRTNGPYFKSKENLVPSVYFGANLLESLMEPFLKSTTDNSVAMRSALRDYLNAVSLEVNTQAISSHPGFQISTSAMKNAAEIMQIAVSNLAADWQALFAKYSDLINRTLRPQTALPGINDKPIGITGTRGMEYSAESVIQNHPDLRTMVDSSTTVRNMAELFSLGEYMLMNDLSDSITLGSSDLIQLKASDGKSFNHNHDEHGSGKMTSLLMNTLYYRCHAACLLELISQLQTKNLFENVVIRNGSEFNRSPRGNGTGSDHGFEAASMAFYSGSIRGPCIIGNIQAQGRTNYPGSWGIRAPVGSNNPNLNGVYLNFGHTLSTIATMLKVPSPITSRDPLVTETVNGIVPAIEKGKIVS